MRSPDQYTDQLENTYRRRAKAAAWFGGLMPLAGVASYEAGHAQAAAARPEITELATRTPQAFINSVDKRANSIRARLASDRDLKIDTKNGGGLKTFYVIEKSARHRGTYDILGVIFKRGDKAPQSTVITLGNTSKTYNDPNATADKVFILKQGDLDTAKFTPGLIELIQFPDAAHSQSMRKYSVSTKNFDGNHPSFGRSALGSLSEPYSPVEGTVVGKQIDGFFKHAETILEADK
jgi:hypothetical protein